MQCYNMSREMKSWALKEGAMNAVETKGTVDAAKYFREEVLDIMPDISPEELSEMVGEYVYYQQVNATKDEAHKAVKETCVAK